MSVNIIAASRRVSDCTVLLESFFIGPDYSAGIALLSTVHDVRANGCPLRGTAPTGPFRFILNRKRGRVSLQRVLCGVIFT